jgi:hypothetical protein
MNTVKNMLDFQMFMLENVHDDDALFRKELKKSKRWLNSAELIALKKWLLRRFHHSKRGAIQDVLSDVT